MKLLNGKKVAILVETEFIHEEIAAHQNFFTKHGAEVDYHRRRQLCGMPPA